MTLADYLPIGLMFLLAGLFVFASLFMSKMVSPNRPTPEKLDPYECGIVPEVEATQRFPVKFYLVAMLFVIFDVEIIFLFAWASIWTSLGWFGVAAMIIFTFFVMETLIYVWKRGERGRGEHRAAPASLRRRQHVAAPTPGFGDLALRWPLRDLETR
ncbi:MAG: NADH-quinone oxidoreductase subunit A [Acidimicrobiia bacterium]